ncbi:uncharacterized protein N7473_001563 [Penicillium subrubescens]|uniref:Knr4/Smi1-like domain-containing protein n=1 Tax=Penicillium subrubescens TaxID=1316194 RepID=A0A1Q5UPV2_9EURO|nr:uncharacterized protein N7473_001563 [Penicillium subrubescens]KAJ5904647.1 hypothetical protein N7473_001563 [Penicillium subrubescens]OKP14501.1 hypothetical protein PENSUB_13989 [Penicillium subrubescens]
MADIRTRFERLFVSLRQTPHIEVLEAEIGPPTNEEDIRFVLQRTKGQLPTGVENFYRALGWVRLEWRHTVKEIAARNMSDQGFVRILPLKEVFDEWEGIIWWGESEGESDDDVAERQEFRSVKPFDMFVPEACVAFLQPPPRLGSSSKVWGQPGEHVAFHYCGEELYKTRYSFDDYIDRLLASRGFWYWSMTLCTETQEAVETKDFRQKMPLLFEDYDDDLFQP